MSVCENRECIVIDGKDLTIIIIKKADNKFMSDLTVINKAMYLLEKSS